MTTKPINTYSDGSGEWYAFRSHGRYLTGFDLWGRPQWASRRDGGVRARIWYSRPYSFDDTSVARLLNDACVELVRLHAFEVPE